MVFSDEAAFQAALDRFYTENYSSLPVGSLPSPHTFSGNGFDYDIAAVRIVAPGAVVVAPGGPVLDPNSLLSIDGAVDLDFGNFSGGGVDAIGGYFYSAFNSGTLLGGNIGLLFSDGFTTDVFSAAGGVPLFFGYTATPGTQLTRLLLHSPSNLAAVDRMTVGNVAFQVPEPSTLCMVVTAALLGLLGLRAGANSRGQPIARAANTGISAAR